jgi:exopolysaccharide biosynthesis protein
MLTADGREGASIGLTLFELASLMKEFGCVNAMNLDGGGSTVMYVKDKIVNRPAMQGGIPLSHVLTVSYKDFS